jgi:nucleotide-binding universal stress UspA family protein
MFRKILLAVDGSPNSDLAVDYAAKLAAAFDATLLIVHAYAQTSDLLGYDDIEKRVAARKTTGQGVIDRARQRLAGSSATITEDLLEGPEAEAILAAADAQKVDLVVMGTRGLGAIKGMLFGSVSHKVAQHVHCPVMLIR